MAGFNINVGSDDDDIRPVDPSTIPQGEEVAGVESSKSKERLLLEKKIRDYEKAVEKVQIRLKSQIVGVSSKIPLGVRAAPTKESLDKVISGLLDKQKNSFERIDVDLRKAMDTARTWVKTSGGTQEDIEHIESLYTSVSEGDFEQSHAKVKELMEALRDVSTKELEARNQKKEQAQKELEAKRNQKIANKEARDIEAARLKELRRQTSADAKEERDRKRQQAQDEREEKRRLKKEQADDSAFQKERAKQVKESAQFDAETAKREFLESKASELTETPFEFLTEAIDRILLMGRRGKVSGDGPKTRRQKILDEAQKVFDKVYKEKTEDRSDIPTPEEVAAGKRSLARGEKPVAPPSPKDVSLSEKGFSLSSGIWSKVAAVATTAVVVDQIISTVISKVGEKTRALTSGDTRDVVGAVTSSSMPGNYVGKALTEITGTLDVIAKNTEQRTMPFSPELLNASINRQLIFLEQNMLRGERLGSVLADISASRTRLEVASQKVADRIIQEFGPQLAKILDFIASILEATLFMVDLFKGFFKELSSGNLNIFSARFWTDVFTDAITEANNRGQATPRITKDMEAFFNNRPQGGSGPNTNIPKGILP